MKSNSTRNSTEPARRGCPWLIYTTGSKQVEEPIRPPRLLNPNVPADLNEFVLRATQKRPDDRFQSGREIQAFLSKQTGVTLTEVGVKTLTVLYDHESGPEVELWMNRVKALAAQIPGAVIRFSSEH